MKLPGINLPNFASSPVPLSQMSCLGDEALRIGGWKTRVLAPSLCRSQERDRSIPPELLFITPGVLQPPKRNKTGSHSICFVCKMGAEEFFKDGRKFPARMKFSDQKPSSLP